MFWFEPPDLAFYFKEPDAFRADIDVELLDQDLVKGKILIYKTTGLINVLYLNIHFSKCTLLQSADAE